MDGLNSSEQLRLLPHTLARTSLSPISLLLVASAAVSVTVTVTVYEAWIMALWRRIIRLFTARKAPPPRQMEENPAEDLLDQMDRIFARKVNNRGVKQRNEISKTTALPRSMAESVERLVKLSRSSHTTAPSLMNFANTKSDGEVKLLKISSETVPEGILPEGFKGELCDIKISGYHPDDNVYSNHQDIRQKIPRGTTVMKLNWEGNKSKASSQDVVIYANRKFTGDIGDEDDTQPENNDQWQKYFLKEQEEAHQVVCMKKINGEAAHFSSRKIDGQSYIITGSKNVHMIIKEKHDIEKYKGDRYTIAKVVARCVWDTLQALEETDRKLLLDFLDQTKCTAVCEILQKENQHIMNLSYLEEPQLNVIGFTPAASEENFNSLVAMPPHHTLDFLSSLGFTVPVYTIIPAEEMQKHREEIRKGQHGYREEGEVLYFLDKDEETIGLVKTKTMWYIMLRALREKVVYAFHSSRRQQQRWSLQERIVSSHKRFAEIQEWLQFSDSYRKKWEELATAFFMWMEEEIEKREISVDEIRPKYPVLWERFLSAKNLTDHMEL